MDQKDQTDLWRAAYIGTGITGIYNNNTLYTHSSMMHNTKVKRKLHRSQMKTLQKCHYFDNRLIKYGDFYKYIK